MCQPIILYIFHINILLPTKEKIIYLTTQNNKYLLNNSYNNILVIFILLF